MRIFLKYNEYIVTFLFFVYYLLIFDIAPVGWDSSVYLGMGKYLWSFGTSGLWEPLRPILLPSILGFFWKIGLDIVFFGKVVALFFTIGVLFMTYLLSSRIFGRNVALLSVLTLGFTPLFFEYSSTIMTEMPSIFFGLLAICLFLEGHHLLTGISAGLSFLFRFPQGIIFLVIGLFILQRRDFKGLLRYALGLSIIVPFLLFNQFMYSSFLLPFTQANQAVHGDFLWLYDQGFFFYFTELFRQNLLFLFCAVGIIIFFLRHEYKNQNHSLLFCITFLIFSYFLLLTHKEARYLLTLLPFLAIIASVSIVEALKYSRRYSIAFVAVMAFIVLSFSLCIMTEYDCYLGKGLPDEKTVKELDVFYHYFEMNQVKGRVLSSSPLPAVYIDNPLIPCYFNFSDCVDRYHENSDLPFLYTTSSFPCNSALCDSQRENFLEELMSEKNLLMSGQIGNEGYYIFSQGLI